MNVLASLLCSCKNENCGLKRSALSEMFVYARCAAWPNMFFHVHPESSYIPVPLISIEVDSCKIITNLYYNIENGNIVRYETIIANMADPECHIKIRKYLLNLLHKYVVEAIKPYNEALELIKKLL